MDVELRASEDGTYRISSLPKEDLILISDDVEWGDLVEQTTIFKEEEVDVLVPIEEYVANGLGWEAFLLTLSKLEGWFVPMLLDEAAWTDVRFFRLFKGIHYS